MVPPKPCDWDWLEGCCVVPEVWGLVDSSYLSRLPTFWVVVSGLYLYALFFLMHRC
jgi:hypothetical protein